MEPLLRKKSEKNEPGPSKMVESVFNETTHEDEDYSVRVAGKLGTLRHGTRTSVARETTDHA